MQSINVLRLVWPSGNMSSLAHETSRVRAPSMPYKNTTIIASQPASQPALTFSRTSPLLPLPLLWFPAPHRISTPPTALSAQPCTCPNFSHALATPTWLPPPALPLNCYNPCTCFKSGLYGTAPKQYKKGISACWQLSAGTPLESSTNATSVSLERTLLFSAAKPHRTTQMLLTPTCGNEDLIAKLHVKARYGANLQSVICCNL